MAVLLNALQRDAQLSCEAGRTFVAHLIAREANALPKSVRLPVTLLIVLRQLLRMVKRQIANDFQTRAIRLSPKLRPWRDSDLHPIRHVLVWRFHVSAEHVKLRFLQHGKNSCGIFSRLRLWNFQQFREKLLAGVAELWLDITNNFAQFTVLFSSRSCCLLLPLCSSCQPVPRLS